MQIFRLCGKKVLKFIRSLTWSMTSLLPWSIEETGVFLSLSPLVSEASTALVSLARPVSGSSSSSLETAELVLPLLTLSRSVLLLFVLLLLLLRFSLVVVDWTLKFSSCSFRLWTSDSASVALCEGEENKCEFSGLLNLHREIFRG